MPRRAGGVVVLACALASCSSSPRETLADASERVASWSAAAEMAGESWTAGLVPGRYAEAAAQAAHRGIEGERARLSAAPRALSDEAVASAAREMSDLAALAARLWSAVRGGDRARAGELAREIGARGRALRDGAAGR